MEYNATTQTFSLSPEQALCLADPHGPADLPGAYLVVRDMFHVRERVLENFRTGQGMEWGEHHPCLFQGTERFFRASYNTDLLASWLPALDGAVDKLTRGAHVADIGCGHGASTILMAPAFPASTSVGFDYHDSSIETARQRAQAAGASNVRFVAADATSYDNGRYNLIAFFDCLHDMADRRRLSPRMHSTAVHRWA